MIDALRKIANEYKKQGKEELMRRYYAISNKINTELEKEMIDMFNKFIHDYYTFHTKRYIRHGQSSPGTETGINLYKANQISKTSGKRPTLTIDFSAENMAGGYVKDDPDTVLGQVLEGVQGLYPYWYQPWVGSYSGKYYSTDGDMQMQAAFDDFGYKFENISRTMFYEQWHRLGW